MILEMDPMDNLVDYVYVYVYGSGLIVVDI